MGSWGSADSKIHVTNKLGRKIYVIVTPNPDWAWADIAASVAVGVAATALTGGAGAPAAAAEVSAAAKTLTSLKKIYDFVTLLLKLKTVAVATAATALQQNVANVTREARTLLKKIGLVIEDGASLRVDETSYLKAWNALNPSYWGALSDGDTVQLLILDDEFEYVSLFSSGADKSWIATEDRIVRAKYGSLAVQDPGAGTEAWNEIPGRWPGVYPSGVNAATVYGNKAHFFNFGQGSYVRYSLLADRTDIGYPKTIAAGWPGLAAIGWTSFTTAMTRGDYIYFFKDTQYVKYDNTSDKITKGPLDIKSNWFGLPWNRVDVAFAKPDGSKAYFFNFSTGQYVRYDLPTDKADTGYPKAISKWPGLWSNFNAAFYSKDGSKIFFFNGSQYIRWDVAADKIDAGYPKSIR